MFKQLKRYKCKIREEQSSVAYCRVQFLAFPTSVKCTLLESIKGDTCCDVVSNAFMFVTQDLRNCQAFQGLSRIHVCAASSNGIVLRNYSYLG